MEAGKRVRAEYDFDAQPDSGEMTIKAGETLTIIKAGIAGGWLEGKNTRGSVGLFPESYVSPVQDSLFSAPVSLAGSSYASSATGLNKQPSAGSAQFDDWGSGLFAPPSHSSQPQPPAFVPPAHTLAQHAASSAPSLGGLPSQTTSNAGDDFDDEWTDEDEEQNENAANHHNALAEMRSSGGGPLGRSQSAHASDRSTTVGAGGVVKVNRNINRFSNFVKSGMEAYILGESRMTSAPSERHEIVIVNGTVMWKPMQQHYNCVVDKPKKETKLKGFKSFIAYSIISSLTGIQVARRYKRFDWLYEQLSAKYIMIPIPPLPEKQMSGRYEEDLIDHRKHILQLWVNKICRHPILSQSEMWLHFISCTDEKEWKNGKRKAEKDEYVGGNFFHCLTIPQQRLDLQNVDRHVERFQRSVKTSEDAMRIMQERMIVFQKAFAGPVKQNWQKMGLAFKTLQASFENDDNPNSRKVTDALSHTASEYHDIGNLFDAHTKKDMEPVVENLFSYKGTVQAVPDILSVHKQVVAKYKDAESKLPSAEVEKMRQRMDSTSYALLAEINHLTSEKVEDFKETMGTYLKRQAEFYQEVANRLKNLSARYE